MLPLRTEGREGKRLREEREGGKGQTEGMEIFQSHRVDGNGNASKHESESHRGTSLLRARSGTLKFLYTLLSLPLIRARSILM